ncbi:MAG: hypothetical protein JWO31_2840 [Phycisphaerales bacterium]|nr:hypothetical protein [Phycisphaerales bacterium]
MRQVLPALCLFVLTFATAACRADDAWPLYRQAGERIEAGDRLGKSSPSATNMAYTGYPPYSPEWERVASAAYEYNAPALADVRRASAMTAAAWPAERVDGHPSYAHLDALRNITNQVGDAALLEHVRGGDASAVARVRDLLHLADLLDDGRPGPILQPLVAAGIRAVALDRLLIVNSGIRLTDQPTTAAIPATTATTPATAGGKAVSVADVDALIRQLFVRDPETAVARADRLVGGARAEDSKTYAKAEEAERVRTVFRRDVTERNLVAMALACRLFRFRNQRWPASLDELAALLPAPPADAAGPMGYALVKAGLPDGGDRPLVYSRAGVPAGGRPAYPTAEPQFSHYSNYVPGNRIPPGQFRDVTLWPGKPDPAEQIALKPLD